MTSWKNDSNAYSVRGSYGSIEEQVQAAASKWMNKNHDKTLEQTREFVSTLADGEYRFQYPFVIMEIVKEDESLTALSFDALNQTVLIRKG